MHMGGILSRAIGYTGIYNTTPEVRLPPSKPGLVANSHSFLAHASS